MNPAKQAEINDLIAQIKAKYNETGLIDALLDPDNATAKGRINISQLNRVTGLPVNTIHKILDEVRAMFHPDTT